MWLKFYMLGVIHYSSNTYYFVVISAAELNM